MARSKETFGKKDVRSKKEKKRKEKEKKRLERKEQGKKGNFDDMIAWVDENGMITDTQPDLTQKKEIKAENIEIAIPKAEFRVNLRIRTGKLKSFDEMKGFGFIVDSETRDSIFVHQSDCESELKAGMLLQFETEKGLKGLKAVNVKPV
ncbi:cold shock domain-containing protein [Prolixibacteraceae bacterium JC049]|nr:cold shock domain-containing protein [Prolixibacteraceae bacterium JC049]